MKGFSAKRAKNVLELARELADTDQFFAEVMEMAEDWYAKRQMIAALEGALELQNRADEAEGKGELQAKRIVAVKMHVWGEPKSGKVSGPEAIAHDALHEVGAEHECPRKTVKIWHR